MSASFTPGPWLVHTTNRIVVQADGAFASVTVKDGKVTGDVLPNSICLLRDPADDFSEDETLANGHLIAAAPELLEALEAILDALQKHVGRSDLEAQPGTPVFKARAARAALAKARSPQ